MEWFRNKTVLEIGCGAGRFTNVLLECGANCIAVDPTNAIHINKKHHSHPRARFIQANICEGIPLVEEADFLLCYGVIQHLEKRSLGIRNMLRGLAPGGRFSMDTYEWRWRLDPYNLPKYLWRPLSKRLPSMLLLKVIRAYLSFWYPMDRRIKKLPKLGPALSALTMIPCYSYPNSGLPPEKEYEWAILDTFDALGAEFDKPYTKSSWRGMWEKMPVRDLDIFRGGNGLIANGVKL